MTQWQARPGSDWPSLWFVSVVLALAFVGACVVIGPTGGMT